MGDEINVLEQRIMDLIEQVHGDELHCIGIRCENCPFHQSNLAIATRGFVRELLYERGGLAVEDE